MRHESLGMIEKLISEQNSARPCEGLQSEEAKEGRMDVDAEDMEPVEA